MIRTVIIDDEPNNVESLAALLKSYCPEVELVGTADSSETGYNQIVALSPQLVLLDIEMPFGNAFDMLDRLAPVSFETVFVTAFDNYAINAFRYSALDYLLKPVNIKQLQATVERAAARIQEKNSNHRVNNLLYNLNASANSQKKMALPIATGLVFIRIDSFMWLEASSNYTNIHLSDSRKIVVAKTLREFEDILPDDLFSRVHHSYIINHNFIKKYHTGRGGYLEMEDGTTIEVSIRKKDTFLSKFRK
jgi:two-component system, LytTR family, response regulator